jgi:hypothetical protein
MLIARCRLKLGRLFLLAGMKIVPANAARLARFMLLYYVPGALTDAEKAEVEEACR